MKKLLFTLFTLLLFPALAFAQGEMVSIAGLRAQVQELGRWTQTYTDKMGRIVDVDIAPVLPQADAVPVITLEKPAYSTDSAYNLCLPAMTTKEQEPDRGTLFTYDNPDTGDQMKLWYFARGEAYDDVSCIVLDYKNVRTEVKSNPKLLESLSGKSYAPEDIDRTAAYLDGYELTVQDALDLANDQLGRLFPDYDIDLEPVWVEIVPNSRPLYNLHLRQRMNGIPILMGIEESVRAIRDAAFDIPKAWESTSRLYWKWGDFTAPSWTFNAYVDHGYCFDYVTPLVQRDVLAEDVPLSALDKVIKSIEAQIEAGHIRNLFSLRFGYCCYMNDADEIVAFPVWMVECDYYFSAGSQTRNYPENDECPITSRLYFRRMLVNAQTGEFADPAILLDRLFDCPDIITWEDVR